MKEIVKNNKTFILLLLGIVCLIFLVVGGTYAFFSAQTSSSQYISGSSFSNGENIKLEISQISAGNRKLIPQSGSAIQNAVVGADDNGSCVDNVGNTICKVYKITVTNLTNVSFNYAATLELSAPNMDNLKWAEGTGPTSGFPTSDGIHIKSFTELDNNGVLGATKSSSSIKNYYVVIWIDEINADQFDSGTFNGTVSVNAYMIDSNGNKSEGITSTFTG